jgi:hypothetical protein
MIEVPTALNPNKLSIFRTVSPLGVQVLDRVAHLIERAFDGAGEWA